MQFAVVTLTLAASNESLQPLPTALGQAAIVLQLAATATATADEHLRPFLIVAGHEMTARPAVAFDTTVLVPIQQVRWG